MENSMIILDCTFRDGGYHNDWNFKISLANKYLKLVEKSRIDAVEIGFRSPIVINENKDNFANVTDKFIEDLLYIPKIKYFGVMINTVDIIKSEVHISNIFKYSDESPINLVRVATHFKDIDLAERICKDLKNFGYSVTCNLMQAADKSFEEIKQASKKLESWKSVDVLYLADSLGGMNHDDINYSYKAIRSEWNGLTGFHGHNNKGQALNNSLEAIDIGVDWIDSTITGMGRGPGNTETEYLLGELNKRGFGEFELGRIYEFSLEEFSSLKKIYNWGPSLLYYLSAEYNIHPIYIQNMLAKKISIKTILNSINYLRTRKSNCYNDNLLKESIKYVS